MGARRRVQPPALLAGTQGFGVYSLPVSGVSTPSSFSVSPASGYNPGDTISATPSWPGTLPSFYTHQWQRCPNNTSCTNIAGATGASYTISNGDAGSNATYEVNVCATNLLTPVPVCKVSNKTTGLVGTLPGEQAWPYHGINDSSIAPDPNHSYPWGTTFTINEGHWATEADPGTQIVPPFFSYQWQGCDQSSTCTVIPGATNASYTTTPADVGDTIVGYVRAFHYLFAPQYPSQFYEAGQTFTIIEKTPANTVPPEIIGSAVIGTTLQSTAGAWDAHDPTFTCRWLRCGSDGLDCQPLNPGQTGHSYTLTSADFGSRLEVELTATQQDPSQNRVTVVSSQPTAVVVNPPAPPKPPTPPAPPAPPRSPTPKAPIIKIGAPQKLIAGARLSGPSKAAGFVKLAYQWLRNGTAIKHATGRRYKLTRKDLGQRISLRVTLTTSAGKRTVVRTKAVRIPKPKPKRKPNRRKRR